jgi:hypothetical protein
MEVLGLWLISGKKKNNGSDRGFRKDLELKYSLLFSLMIVVLIIDISWSWYRSRIGL